MKCEAMFYTTWLGAFFDVWLINFTVVLGPSIDSFLIVK